MAEKVIRVATIGAIPRGRMRVIWAGRKLIAVFNVDGSFYAIDNECPHQGGPLGEGSLSGTVVSCPWHVWRYDVTSGKCLSNPFAQVQRYPVHVSGDEVWVTIAS